MLIKRISTILLLSMIFGSFFPPIRVSANTGFHIRPPFIGDFKLTSYFDHTSPTGVRDYDYITIYTGDTSEDGDPYYYSAHGGLDWGMDVNTPIYAVADGNVRFIGDEGAIGFGKYIQIDHNNGYFSIYAHLSSVYIIVILLTGFLRIRRPGGQSRSAHRRRVAGRSSRAAPRKCGGRQE